MDNDQLNSADRVRTKLIKLQRKFPFNIHFNEQHMLIRKIIQCSPSSSAKYLKTYKKKQYLPKTLESVRKISNQAACIYHYIDPPQN